MKFSCKVVISQTGHISVKEGDAAGTSGSLQAHRQHDYDGEEEEVLMGECAYTCDRTKQQKGLRTDHLRSCVGLTFWFPNGGAMCLAHFTAVEHESGCWEKMITPVMKRFYGVSVPFYVCISHGYKVREGEGNRLCLYLCHCMHSSCVEQ